MWENAKAFGALLVFAEHRFYGASQPKTATMVNSTTSSSVQDDDSPTSTPVVLQHPYLSHELALADYAVLIETIRRQRGFEFPLMLNLETEEFVGTPPVLILCPPKHTPSSSRDSIMCIILLCHSHSDNVRCCYSIYRARSSPVVAFGGVF